MIALVWSFATASAQEEAAPPVAPVVEPQALRKFGIDIQVGSLANSDPAWDVFGGERAMPSFGLSGSARVLHNLSIVAAWHHVRQGAVIIPSQDVGTDTDDVSD